MAKAFAMAVSIIVPWILILSSGFYVLQAQISDSCNCGSYGVCSSSENGAATCDCIQGYIPLDPDDLTKGCHPETIVNYCSRGSVNFTVEQIEDVNFPSEFFVDLARIENVDIQGCKKAIMEDCNTLAASLVNSTCHIKRSPFSGRKNSSTVGITSLIKVPVRSSTKKNSDIRKVLKICLIVSAVLAFLFGVSAFHYYPATRRLLKKKKQPLNAIGVGFREFTLEELEEATNGFSKMLGRGSSGKVYAGVLSLKDAEIQVAVKRLEKGGIERSENEFMTELTIIGRTYHKNLVRLLGFCVENDQRILVYEFMANGALSGLLFGEGERPSWGLRAEIAIGVSRGLLYLHEECETQIIHCDIKPQNVLLDMNYTAKIADFGLSKLLRRDQTRTDTGLRGTMGYLAPEWLRSAAVTTKVDVFSFGMMLFEIICGRRHIELDRVEEESEEDDLVLSTWVLKCLLSGNLETVVGHDPEVLSDFKRFERMALVGLWCIHPDPTLRPSMKKVTQMLDGTLEVGIPPLLDNQMY